MFIAGFIVSLPVWYVFIGLAEYWVHRSIMHLPWHIHRTHHHRKHANKPVHLHVDLPIYWHLLVTSPIWWMLNRSYTGSSWLTGDYFEQSEFLLGASGCLMALLMLHSWIFSKFHRAFHMVENNWTMKTKWYGEMLDHHILHHINPETNFGLMFLWTDDLFGTRS